MSHIDCLLAMGGNEKEIGRDNGAFWGPAERGSILKNLRRSPAAVSKHSVRGDVGPVAPGGRMTYEAPHPKAVNVGAATPPKTLADRIERFCCPKPPCTKWGYPAYAPFAEKAICRGRRCQP